MKPLNIAVIGLSHAGVVCALQLYRRGNKVTIYEQEKNPHDLSFQEIKNNNYIEYIGQKGAEILKQVKAGPFLENEQSTNKCRGIKNGRGNILSSFDGYHGTHNGIMRSLLDCFSHLCPDGKVKFEARVGFVDVNEGIVKTQDETSIYDLIVGCDGISSVVREAIQKEKDARLPKKEEYPRRGKMLYSDIPHDNPDPEYVKVYSPHPLVFGMELREMGNKKIAFFVETTKKVTNLKEARNYLDTLNRKVSLLVSDEQLTAFVDRPEGQLGRSMTGNNYFYGKAVLVGDAAHPLPILGQGESCAALGALNLSQQLFLYDNNLEKAFPQYDKIQRREAESCLQIADSSSNLLKTVFQLYLVALGIIPHLTAIQADFKGRTYSQIAKSYDSSAKLSRSLGVGLLIALSINSLLWGVSGFMELSAIMAFLFSVANFLALRKSSSLNLKVFHYFFGIVLGANLGVLLILVFIVMVF